MKRFITPIVFCLSLSALSAHACTEGWPSREQSVVKGHATSATGEKLYTETLYFEPGPGGGSLRVDYTSPSMELVARKIVKYDCNPTTPSFELTDLLEDVREGVSWNDGEVISYLDDDKTVLEFPDGQTIVDAGFDNAIRMNWEALMAGDKVRFNYLLTQDNRFIKLRLAKAGEPTVVVNDESDDTVFFKIAANNMLFRLLSNPIYVGYDPKTQAIRYYIGPSNLRSMADRKNVIIRYMAPGT